MPTTNAIMQRIETLTEMWEQFAEHPAARLACWQFDHDGRRMFDLFLDLQYEEASDVPDLFIRCGEPLTNAAKYADTLRESVARQYDEIRESLAKEGIAADWRCPPRRRNQNGWDALVAACESLRQAHESIVRHVVMVLLPENVSDGEAWREWLQQLLARTIPENVRFLVLDAIESPQLSQLCPGEPERVMELKPELKMGMAYLELLREVPGSGPGFLFRRFYVALGNAVGAGNIDAARRLADHASRIATQQQWPHLQAAVVLALGAAFISKKDFDSALDCYRKGFQAVAGVTDDAGRKVAVQSQFAEASALIAASRPAEAAKVYEQIQAAGKPMNDPFAGLEGARMAAYCHELAGNRDAAWKRALEALAVGESAGPSAAGQSTLPFLGHSLLRLAEGRPAADGDLVRQRLEKLLGKNWDVSSAGGPLT